MKMYSRQIKSVADLRKEKARLEKQCRQLEQDAVNEVTNIRLPGLGAIAENARAKAGSGGLESLLGNIIPGAAPVLKIVEDLIPGGSNIAESIRKKTTKLAGGAAKEIIGGYLKWKAVELGFRGIRYFISTRKKKKAAKAKENKA